MDDNNAKNPDRNTERWLDAALSARMGAQAEPQQGLEERILARLAAEPKRNPVLTWRLAFAAVAAAVLISAALLLMRTGAPEKPSSARTSRPQPNPEQIATVQPQVVPRRPERVNRRRLIVAARRSNARGQKEVMPKLVTFPAPAPETDQERMLARLAARREAFELASESPDAGIKDLQVKELAVEPMEGTPPDARWQR